ncbi:cache domain-containing protein [Zobellia roscoffensis]|uniref:cache domain-containing protein n=1 Tax=Zobellia roscoffensis TaxID=2779508 RepID=UPI00188DA747|nr:cache domain-containing protein [Zobellia roscoffensis]
MPATSSLGNSLRKPFTANKRLFTLLTVAFIIIGLFFAIYYSHIKNNEHHYRESKLHSLDANFDIITKQLNNDFQKYYSTEYNTISTSKEVTTELRSKHKELTDLQWNDSLEAIKKMSLVNRTSKKSESKNQEKKEDHLLIKQRDSITKNKIRPKVWNTLKHKISESTLFDQEFDEYIVVFKRSAESNEKNQADSIIELSSLKGRIILPDSLNKLNPFNIGMSIGIPKDDEVYQLFGREYTYETDLDTRVHYDIKIFGLVETERYNEAVRKLDPWIIALLTTFLLLGLFGMPYFKMLFIAEDERLSSNDVILSGISVIIGAPILIIVFFSLTNHYYDYYYKIPDQLDDLSKKIKTSFEAENTSNVTSLYEMSLSNEELKAKDTLASAKNGESISIPISEANGIYRENHKFISKIDAATGAVKYHVRLIDKNNIKNTINLGSRPYYTDYVNSKNLWFQNTSANKIKYVMRPVVSIEDQSEEAIYLLKNEEDLVSGYRVGAAQLKSLHEAILPFGFQFALVDETGEVWFHSKKGRATLENFLYVSRNKEKIEAAMLARIKTKGMVNYRDEGQLYSIRPVANTNLSVIALYDIGLLRTKISEVLTLSCIGIVLALTLILIITILSLIIKNPKLGLYKYDRFLFEFLTPKKELRDSYIILSILLTGLITIAFGISFLIPPTTAYILCLLLGIYSYLIIFYTLHPHRGNNDFKFKVRDILLLLAIIFLNILTCKVNENEISYVLPSLILQFICLAVIYFNKSSKKTKFITKVHSKVHSIIKNVSDFSRRKNRNIRIGYSYWYALFLFCWLLLSTVFPAYLIFKNAKFLNDKIWSKTDKIDMARRFMDKEKELETSFPAFTGQEDEYAKLHEKHLNEGQYHETFTLKETTNTKTSKNASINTDLEDFLWHIRPTYDVRIAEFQGMVYEYAHDFSWASEENPNTFYLNYLDSNKAICIADSSLKNSTGSLPPKFILLVVIGLIIILAILFSLILFFSDRFFAFRFRHLKPNDFDTNKEEGYIEKFGQILHDEKSNSGLLLIGPPFCGKQTFAKEILVDAGYLKIATLSMLQLENIAMGSDISETLGVLSSTHHKSSNGFDHDDYEAFVIEHLEHNIKSFDANHTKLRIILFLISQRKRIILVSEVYPSQIFSMYESAQEEAERSLGSLQDDFNSWRNILSAFPQILIGITKNTKKVSKQLNFGLQSAQKPSSDDIDILTDELGYSKFLPTLAPVILVKSLYDTPYAVNQPHRLDRQRMVMHTQNLAHGYYNDIWNTLPTRERYLLYDLAKDGFMNIKNRNSLFSLMKKGLVVWHYRPKIFNYSFKNFIMTSVSLNEALRLENKNRGKGTWANTRILFYLLIITVIVFIGLGKPELLKDFETLVGTLGGLGVLIPLISKLLASGGQKL